MNSFLETLKQLGTTRLAIMGGVLVGLLLFFVFVSMRITAPSMTLLYSDLSQMDSSAVAQKLGEAKIPFDISSDGARISVSEKDVGPARMLLAQSGLPNGASMGYEIFDNQSGFGTTNFVQNINQVRALEGELARTIASLEQVRNARVHLVLPQRELFSRQSRPSSASVFLSLRPGARLNQEQILSIQQLVSSAVPELNADRVAVVDSEGSLLARGDGEQDGILNMKAEELRRSYEMRMTQAVEDIVGRIVGYGGVRANVTADLNFDRITTNEELYDPETQVVRSSQVIEESEIEREPPPQDVSVQNNLPGIAGDFSVDAQPTMQNNRVEEVTNYEISRTVRSLVREVGEVRRLSVAVLVDGIYTTDADGKRVYQPRDEQQLEQIQTLVRSAIGFDQTRGDTVEVVNMQFADLGLHDGAEIKDLLFGFERSEVLNLVEILAVSIMVILVILLVLQPMVNRLLATGESALGDEIENELLAARAHTPALMGPDGLESEGFEPPVADDEDDQMIDMQRVEGKVKASAVKKVEDIVAQYPEETVSVLRSWMTQES